MLAWSAAACLGVALLEIWLIVQVGHAIGGWPTFGLLLLSALLGTAVLRHEGRRVWAAFRSALQERRLPALEVADGALVIIGGTLLIVPGFLSDFAGLIAILPPTRVLLRRLLTTVVARRLGVPAANPRPDRTLKHPPRVIDGEVVDDEE